MACVSLASGMRSLGPQNWEINMSCLAAAKQRVDTEPSCSRASKSPGNDARVGAAWRSQHDPDQGSIIIAIDLAMLRPEDVPILVESSKARPGCHFVISANASRSAQVLQHKLQHEEGRSWGGLRAIHKLTFPHLEWSGTVLGHCHLLEVQSHKLQHGQL